MLNEKTKLCDNRDHFSPLQIYSSQSIHNQSNLSPISSSFSFKLYFFSSDPIRLNESIRISSFDRQDHDKKDSTVKLFPVFIRVLLEVIFLENVAESCNCKAKGYSGV